MGLISDETRAFKTMECVTGKKELARIGGGVDCHCGRFLLIKIRVDLRSQRHGGWEISVGGMTHQGRLRWYTARGID